MDWAEPVECDATMVQAVVYRDAETGEPTDSAVVLGVGMNAGPCQAVVALCPAEGVEALIVELREAAAEVVEYHADQERHTGGSYMDLPDV